MTKKENDANARVAKKAESQARQGNDVGQYGADPDAAGARRRSSPTPHRAGSWLEAEADAEGETLMAVYTVHILSDRPHPTPYTWQILEAGGILPAERARESFRTAISAKVAGHRALRQLQERAK